MTPFSSWFKATEQDVVDFIAKVKKDAPVVEADIKKSMQWVVANSGSIAADIKMILSFARVVGVLGAPQFAAAVQAANVAVYALNAVANAHQSGQSDAQSVVNGYVAVKQAHAAVAQAAVAVASK